MSNRDANLAAIKEGLYSISKQLSSAPKARPTNDIKTLASKLFNSLHQDKNPVERFYFIYLLCQICSSEKPVKVDKLMKMIIPSQMSSQSLSFISDMISFALCHPSQYTAVLDNMSSYVNLSSSIQICIESWSQAETLALDSPSFCSALISRGDLTELKIGKKLLAKWLQDLSKTDRDFPAVNLNQLIRYSLLSARINQSNPRQISVVGSTNTSSLDSDLHFGILTIIQSRRCQTLTNQFLIDIISILSKKLKESSEKEEEKEKKHEAEQIIDRFAQILSVAASSKTTSITNTLRASLTKLESNQIIAAVIEWQNK